MPILVILGLEKRITQRDRLDILHINVLAKLRINVEEHWHVSIQVFFLRVFWRQIHDAPGTLDAY